VIKEASTQKKKARKKSLNNFHTKKVWVKTVWVVFSLCVLLLDQKNQKSRMPDRLRAAFSPSRLGVYLSGFSSFWRYKIIAITSRKVSTIFFSP